MRPAQRLRDGRVRVRPSRMALRCRPRELRRGARLCPHHESGKWHTTVMTQLTLTPGALCTDVVRRRVVAVCSVPARPSRWLARRRQEMRHARAITTMTIGTWARECCRAGLMTASSRVVPRRTAPRNTVTTCRAAHGRRQAMRLGMAMLIAASPAGGAPRSKPLCFPSSQPGMSRIALTASGRMLSNRRMCERWTGR